MNHSTHFSEEPAAAAASNRVRGVPRPGLALVTARFQLAQPDQPAPDTWREGLDGLLGWLGIVAEFVPVAPSRRLPRMTDWALPAASGATRRAPVFAPWLGWSPSAFQHGGLAGMPSAQFAASYLTDQGIGRGAAQAAGIDLVLMSPHPALCATEDAGGVPMPRADVLKAMIRAARNEGREKLAIILHARQRNGIARQLLAADRALTRDGLAIEILTIEEALRPLMAGASAWDAIIAMPDLRSIVFTLLAEVTGVRGPWPMLWQGGDALLVCSEAAGEGTIRPSLDAPALVQALALVLHHSGANRAAWRLHEAWARMRDTGLTTPGRGSDAPYVNAIKDTDFIAMLCHGQAGSKRPVKPWRALGQAEVPNSGSLFGGLRVVASNPADSPHWKGC